jgi:hypothetical protein
MKRRMDRSRRRPRRPSSAVQAARPPWRRWRGGGPRRSPARHPAHRSWRLGAACSGRRSAGPAGTERKPAARPPPLASQRCCTGPTGTPPRGAMPCGPRSSRRWRPPTAGGSATQPEWCTTGAMRPGAPVRSPARAARWRPATAACGGARPACRRRGGPGPAGRALIGACGGGGRPAPRPWSWRSRARQAPTREAVVRGAGRRGTIASRVAAAPGAVGLEHATGRTWTGGSRHRTRAMGAWARRTRLRAGMSAGAGCTNRLGSPREARPRAAVTARHALPSRGASPPDVGGGGGWSWPCRQPPVTAAAGRTGGGGTNPSPQTTTRGVVSPWGGRGGISILLPL